MHKIRVEGRVSINRSHVVWSEHQFASANQSDSGQTNHRIRTLDEYEIPRMTMIAMQRAA